MLLRGDNMPLFLIDLEQCPPFYRADLRMAIQEEIRKTIRIRNAIEEHNETKTRKDEYQATLDYLTFLNRALGRLEALLQYDSRII